MAISVSIESLRSVTYLKTENLTHGRTLQLMPLWDGENWHLWVDTPAGLIEGKLVDTIEGDYVAAAPAKESDLFIPFIDVMWQRANWPEVCSLIIAISDDFHNMGTSAVKLKHFFECRAKLSGSASRFARTEIEYLVMLCRSVFDLLQEIVSILWTKVQLNDEAAEKRRHSTTLPDTFSKVVLHEKRRPRTSSEIEAKYALPQPLAAQYAVLAPFFSQLRDVRDSVIHGKTGVPHIFETERGFCVNPKAVPFSSFQGWRSEHYFNENIVSILPWIASTIVQTIDACSSLINTFASIIALPPEIAPGYRIFVRGLHNAALTELLQVHSGGPAWWIEQSIDPKPTA